MDCEFSQKRTKITRNIHKPAQMASAQMNVDIEDDLWRMNMRELYHFQSFRISRQKKKWNERESTKLMRCHPMSMLAFAISARLLSDTVATTIFQCSTAKQTIQDRRIVNMREQKNFWVFCIFRFRLFALAYLLWHFTMANVICTSTFHRFHRCRRGA